MHIHACVGARIPCSAPMVWWLTPSTPPRMLTDSEQQSAADLITGKHTALPIDANGARCKASRCQKLTIHG